jgi:uncharacterized membrane protein
MNNRDLSVDALRGIAVFLMVASHTVWYLSDDKNYFWNLMRSWGDSVCFISFLFVFGISMYFSLLSKDFAQPEIRKRALHRLLVLLGSYYLIAFFSLVTELNGAEKNVLDQIFRVLVFAHVPGFTEFMPPFVFYTAVAFIIKFVLRRKSIRVPEFTLPMTIMIGVLFYTAGMVLYHQTKSVPLPEFVGAYTALVINHDGFLRFALVQYTPVLLLGIYFGKLLKTQAIEERSFLKQVLTLFFVLYAVALGIWTTELWVNDLYLNMFFRWPPSILFMLFGLCFALIALWLLRMTKEGRFHEVFSKIGISSMGILVFHICALSILKLAGVNKTDNFLYLLGYFILLLAGFDIIKYIYRSLRKLTGKELIHAV